METGRDFIFGALKSLQMVAEAMKLKDAGSLEVVQLSCSVVSDSTTLWTAAPQASLSITNSPGLLKLMSIKSVLPSNHLILKSYDKPR